LILFESEGRYQTGIEMSRAMAAEDSRYFLPRQFENPINVHDHEYGTGREIIAQIKGKIDAFVTGFGTGGTLAGCGRAIKQAWPEAKIIAMEPAEQALLAGECPCCHFIEGVADGFIPELLREAPLDEHIEVTSAEAMAMTRRLHREFGLLVGTSSGANVAAAVRVACRLGPGCDGGNTFVRPGGALLQHGVVRAGRPERRFVSSTLVWTLGRIDIFMFRTEQIP
jgi:cysteine synthase A